MAIFQYDIFVTSMSTLTPHSLCPKRNLCLWHKETAKRPIHMAIMQYDIFVTSMSTLTPHSRCPKKTLCLWHRETENRPIHMANQTYSHGKKGLFIRKRDSMPMAKRDRKEEGSLGRTSAVLGWSLFPHS